MDPSFHVVAAQEKKVLNDLANFKKLYEENEERKYEMQKVSAPHSFKQFDPSGHLV